MKAFDLQPTDDDLKSFYLKDSIGRNKEIGYFITLLNAVDGKFSIAVDGKWGSGKTFFIKQTKIVMDSFNSHIANQDLEQVKDLALANILVEVRPQVSIYYDAWSNDNDEDPILSLIYVISKSMITDFNLTNHSFVGIFTSVVEFLTGKKITAIIDSLKGENPLAELAKNKSLETQISEFFDSILQERGERLIIFVDELDRCRPDYAVRLLERIKHYFSNENITFVFSINKYQLQHTIKCCYGNDFDAYAYLNRFFDLSIPLAPADLNKYYTILGKTNNMTIALKIAEKLVKKFDFQLREISKLINLVSMATSKKCSTMRYSIAYDFCRYLVLPILIGLQIKNADEYLAFVTGNNVSLFVEILSEYSVGELLDSGESYNENDLNMIIVTKEEKLTRVYNILFRDQTETLDSSKVGNLDLNHGVKNELLKMNSFLSRNISL